MNKTSLLVTYLIGINKELIEKTALGNCHAIGLNSFIINEKPRMRLFIAERHCELFNHFEYYNPIIPIHPHKYTDIFEVLEGTVTHHIYVPHHSGVTFNKYKYNRLSDTKTNIEQVGTEALVRESSNWNTNTILKSNQLHTVSLHGGNGCCWLITETFPDDNFEQIAYHQNLVHRPELYTPIENPYDYLKQYFSI